MSAGKLLSVAGFGYVTPVSRPPVVGASKRWICRRCRRLNATARGHCPETVSATRRHCRCPLVDSIVGTGKTSGTGVDAARETDAVGRLAEHLRAVREELGMSLKELESRTHTSASSLSRYLSGKAAAP